jgi:hypothetical protein
MSRLKSFTSTDVDVATFTPSRSEWAFLLQLFFVDDDGREVSAALVACSSSWVGSQGWTQAGVYWTFTATDGAVFPWGWLILQDDFSSDHLQLALDRIVAICNDASWDTFYTNMSRFVWWDDDDLLTRSGAAP